MQALKNAAETFVYLRRSFSAEAALDHRDTAVIEEASRAVTVHKQEREVKKVINRSKSSASKAAFPEARIVDDSLHPIRQQDIPRGAWTALLKLRGAGDVQSSLTDLLPFSPLPHLLRPAPWEAVCSAGIDSGTPTRWLLY